MKLSQKIIAAVTTLTCLFSASSVTANSSSRLGSVINSSQNSPVELTFVDAQYGCSYNIDIKVDVYKDNSLVTTLSQGESILLSEGMNGVRFKYKENDSSCNFYASSAGEYHYKNGEAVPNLAGYNSQTNLQNIVNGLESYEDLYLAELGSTNTNSSYYDLQDVVMIINNNPSINNTPTLFLD